ncbi:ATP-dependent nuclease [Xenorhabdus indica]|uniref:ATP-dependent nuclease n=1 Tax=Xenorhabdus indica TaxID=333964 RepID=UPI001656B53F|nr:AAA family ATPase [Xenorhabdus indica]MBC8945196.1 DNA replication and repair protein RecF [Xenorhabdus indica]
MIKEIEIHKYRKIENLKFSFDPSINVISGTNGTCKTSLLHIISNSVKAPTASSENYSNPNCFKIIKNTNVILNPKIESLVREAKNYVDPSNGVKGNLFEVEYNNELKLKFRKHNSKIANRYGIKPYYKKEDKQSLPSCPVIYLGLSRLLPTGEVDDEFIKNIKHNLPDEYVNIISNLYGKLINISITDVKIKNVNNLKSGPEFNSSTIGIDSNTISSGEDNLFIILKALVSLAYYHDSLISVNNTSSVSVLLIDEFDATLHPSLQEKLFDIIYEYSLKYKIQVFITTHSLSLLEYVLEQKQNVIYLLNNYTDVDQIERPTIIDIKMHLKNDTRDDIYNKKRIPIFTEDEEARLFLDEIFSYFEEKNKNFALVRRFFHLIPCKIGADNLLTIFSDPYLLETSLKSICILDGDKKADLNKCTITLPGNESPEKMFFDYIEYIYLTNDTTFWKNRYIMNQGYTKQKYLDDIRHDILNIKKELDELTKEKKSSKGKERNLNKAVFNKHPAFFRLVIRHWLQNKENNYVISLFFNNLKKSFFKVCIPNGIEKREWNLDFKIEN